jgi:hypothetical protein
VLRCAAWANVTSASEADSQNAHKAITEGLGHAKDHLSLLTTCQLHSMRLSLDTRWPRRWTFGFLAIHLLLVLAAIAVVASYEARHDGVIHVTVSPPHDGFPATSFPELGQNGYVM